MLILSLQFVYYENERSKLWAVSAAVLRQGRALGREGKMEAASLVFLQAVEGERLWDAKLLPDNHHHHNNGIFLLM